MPDTAPHAPRRSRVAAGISGLLAGLAAVAVSEAVAALLTGVTSPVLAVGNRAVDATPRPVKEWAIEHFGSHDKPVLILGVLLTLALLAVGLGVLGARRPAAAVAGFLVLSAVAAAAAIGDRAATAGPVARLAPVAALTVTGVTALLLLLRTLRAPATAPSPGGTRDAPPPPGGEGAAAGARAERGVRSDVRRDPGAPGWCLLPRPARRPAQRLRPARVPADRDGRRRRGGGGGPRPAGVLRARGTPPAGRTDPPPPRRRRSAAAGWQQPGRARPLAVPHAHPGLLPRRHRAADPRRPGRRVHAARPRHGRHPAGAELRRPPRPPAGRATHHPDLRLQPGGRRVRRQRDLARRTGPGPARRGRRPAGSGRGPVPQRGRHDHRYAAATADRPGAGCADRRRDERPAAAPRPRLPGPDGRSRALRLRVRHQVARRPRGDAVRGLQGVLVHPRLLGGGADQDLVPDRRAPVLRPVAGRRRHGGRSRLGPGPGDQRRRGPRRRRLLAARRTRRR